MQDDKDHTAWLPTSRSFPSSRNSSDRGVISAEEDILWLEKAVKWLATIFHDHAIAHILLHGFAKTLDVHNSAYCYLIQIPDTDY